MKKTVRYLCGAITVCSVILAMSGTAAFSEEATQEETEIITECEPETEQLFQCGDYVYKLNDDETAMIVEYTGQEADIEIPAELDGHSVTVIAVQAFSYAEMNSLTIPENITTIDSRAFEYCSVKDTFSLPAGISIQSDAFSYAKLPKAVVIPEEAVIEGDSFSYCTGLETLFAEPGAVLTGDAFSYSRNLLTVALASGSKVSEDAFYSCGALKSIVLAGSVELGAGSFPYCDNAAIKTAGEDEYAQLMEEAMKKAAEAAS